MLRATLMGGLRVLPNAALRELPLSESWPSVPSGKHDLTTYNRLHPKNFRDSITQVNQRHEALAARASVA